MENPHWGRLDRAASTWRLGSSRVWIRVRDDEWEVASTHVDDDQDPDAHTTTIDHTGPTDAPEEIVWTRFVTTLDDEVSTRPGLPDRPVVVRPASPMVLLPGRWGRFFFRVPLWTMLISNASGRELVMSEIPSKALKSIWFGSIAGGELCYAIEAPLERSVEDLEVDRSFAICEVTVRNSSRERLHFERICVHVEYMSLFDGGDRLWTNEVRVTFKGSEQVSQLSFLPGPPHSVSGAQRVAPSRLPPESDLIKRSFALIREITGI